MIFIEWSTARIRPWMVAFGSATLFVGAVCLGDEIQNRQLLETLPRDRRASLAENLERFDRLGGLEQTAIRRLDKTIEATDPVEQERFRALLQNYHLWFQGLTEEQQTTLLATTDLDERFKLAKALRLAAATGTKRDGPRFARIRTGDFGLIGPYEVASLLQVWQKLSPEKRAEIEKKPPAKIREEIKGQIRALKIRFDLVSFPAEQEKAYVEKLEKDDEFKPLISRLEQMVRKPDVQKKVDNAQKRFEHPFAEFLYFEEKPPPQVDPARLERFSESCPEWLHAMTDSLSADDARAYFSIVYRLIYPGTAEMLEPTKPTKVDAASKKAPAEKGKSSPNSPAF